MISSHFLELYWLISVAILSVMVGIRYAQASGSVLLHENKYNNLWTWGYALTFIFLLGFRNVYDPGFGDTVNYRRLYYIIQDSNIPPSFTVLNSDGEWVWEYLHSSFAYYGFAVETFFFVIAAGYIGFMVWGTKRLFKVNEWIAWLFCVSSFSFMTYGYNGLRNGLACSMVIVAISYIIQKDKRGLIIGLIISALAIGIHRSVLLPVLCCFVATYLVTSTRKAIVFWFLSILISLLFGTEVQTFFSNLGYDERMSSYAGTFIDDLNNEEGFSHTGFRFDFLLYSAMPIYLGYVIIYRFGIRNIRYEQLLNTYIFANSIWIMVIRSNFSNRFAYLSWFMYPIVLAYPLLNVQFVKNQDRLTARILLLSVAFTLFMEFIYW